jgi:hypothetical protein
MNAKKKCLHYNRSGRHEGLDDFPRGTIVAPWGMRRKTQRSQTDEDSDGKRIKQR